MKECRTWIFGYGSLMWNPGFAYHCWRPALLSGYHRSYGMFSTRNRGTTGQPGMILSLAPGRHCTGRAFHVEPGQEQAALEYLDEREGLGRAHLRVRVPLHLLDGEAGPNNLGKAGPSGGGQTSGMAGAEGNVGIRTVSYMTKKRGMTRVHG